MIPGSQKGIPTWEEGAHAVQPTKRDQGYPHPYRERVWVMDKGEGSLGMGIQMEVEPGREEKVPKGRLVT